MHGLVGIAWFQSPWTTWRTWDQAVQSVEEITNSHYY